jgi:steroid delta-isomerase-like uncharacterized protein
VGALFVSVAFSAFRERLPAPKGGAKEGAKIMSIQTNKQAVRRLFEEAWNQGKLGVVDELVDAKAVGHDPSRLPGIPDSAEGIKMTIQAYRAAFPDLHFTVDGIMGEGEEVTARFTVTGTNTGALMGGPATGKKSSVTGIVVDRFDHGKIVEAWVSWDQMGQLRQLGLLPSA